MDAQLMELGARAHTEDEYFSFAAKYSQVGELEEDAIGIAKGSSEG